MGLLACWGRSAYAQSDTIMAHELASWMQEADPYLRSVAYNPTSRDFKLEKEYLHCLDKLMTDAPDIPLAVEVYICKALWLSYSNLVGTKAEAVRVCEEGIRRFPSYSRTEELRRIRDELLCPQFTLRSQADPYPGDTLKLEVRYWMLNAPVRLRIYRTCLQTCPNRDDCNNDKVFCQSSPKLVYEANHEFPLPPASDGKLSPAVPGMPTDTVIDLPLPTQPGIYVLEAAPQSGNGSVDRQFFALSRLRILKLELDSGTVEMTALDNKTGHPIAGVTIDFYTPEEEVTKRKLIKSVTTGKDGKARIRWQWKERNAYYVAHKGEDRFMPPQWFYKSKEASSTRSELALLIDRPVYRPGQTVCLKGVAYSLGEDSAQVLGGEPFEVGIWDSERNKVAACQVKTNEWGSFSTALTLPNHCPKGTFVVRVQGKAEERITFRVEDAGQPSCEIVFQSPGGPYNLGDSVTVHGQVLLFDKTTAAQDLLLSYQVTNETSRWHPEEGERVKAGTLHPDAEGRFSIGVKIDTCLPMLSPDQFIYKVEASVKDNHNEEQKAFCLLLGNRPRSWSTSYGIDFEPIVQVGLRYLLYKESKSSWKLTNDPARKMEVNWQVYRLGRNEEQASATPVLSGTCFTNEPQSCTPLQSLPSGNYRLQATVTDSDGNPVKMTHSFTLLSKHDSRLPMDKPLFVYKEHTEVEVGEQASFYVGTSLKDACLWVDTVADGQRIGSRMMQLSDTLMRMEMPYDASYGRSLSILFYLLHQGKLYKDEVRLARKVPADHLQLKWTAFCDSICSPGKGEWRMKVSRSDGSPANAEVAVWMYDTAIDRHYSNRLKWGVSFRRGGGNYYIRDSNYDILRLSPVYTLPRRNVPPFGSDVASGSPKYLSSLYDRYLKQLKGLQFIGGHPFGSYLLMRLRDIYEQSRRDIHTRFRGTAFFYPQLHTDGRGEVVIPFTMPADPARWKVCVYAHTPEMQTGMLETTLRTTIE